MQIGIECLRSHRCSTKEMGVQCPSSPREIDVCAGDAAVRRQKVAIQPPISTPNGWVPRRPPITKNGQAQDLVQTGVYADGHSEQMDGH